MVSPTQGWNMKTEASLLPEPRSYAGTSIMFAAITALPFGFLWSWLFGTMAQRPFGEVLPFGLVGGLVFGVLFGLMMGLFFQGMTATVAFSNEKEFRAQLNVAMAQLGYNPASQAENFLTYKPSLQAGLAAGRISVQVREGEAVVVGPRMYVRKLATRLAA